MIFLSDLSTVEFARKVGSCDKKPRILGRLRKSTLNPNTANAAAVGGGIGWGLGRAADTFRKSGSKALGERYRALGGLAVGTGLGIHSQYKKLRKQQ